MTPYLHHSGGGRRPEPAINGFLQIVLYILTMMIVVVAMITWRELHTLLTSPLLFPHP